MTELSVTLQYHIIRLRDLELILNFIFQKLSVLSVSSIFINLKDIYMSPNSLRFLLESDWYVA